MKHALLIRAVVAFLALPGIVGGALPVWIARSDAQRDYGCGAGIALLALGLFLLLWCVRDFFVSGQGTLAPWDSPKRLVIVGLYRCVRNPMYLAVLTLVSGWSLAFGSPLVGAYLVVLAIGFHLRVVFFEEPRLQQQFGAEWKTYSASVRRWWPRLSQLKNAPRA